MEAASRGETAARALGVLAVAATVGLGVLVRLQEPLSNPVIPAEDPFTHIARVKTYLAASGLPEVGPFGEDLYPPGMHATFAAVWAFTGGDLYTLFRFAPVVLGGVSVLGTALLLWKHVGRVAAVVGGLGVALAPEIVFRTTMMAPTAVDVAVIPFLFFAFLEVLAGRLAWTPVAAALTLYLVFMHPWLVGMLVAAGLVFALLTAVLPWPSSRADRLSTRGFAASLAVLGGGLGLVLSTCGGVCGPGYQQVLPVGSALVLAAPVVIVLSLLPAVFLAVQPRALEGLPEHPFEPRSWMPRAALGLALAAIAGLLTLGAVRGGLPTFVDLPRMIGWPLLALGAFAFVALPFLATPAAYIATGLTVTTYPVVIVAPLGSEFVSHRTVAYLGLGLSLLAGIGAQALAGWARDAVGGTTNATGRTSSALGLAAIVLVAGTTGAAVATETPDPYEDGWYRLYEPCELDALRSVADRVGSDPDTIVVTGDWRPNTVLAAIAEPGPRIWFDQSFLVSADEREGLATELEAEPGSLYFLEERHLHNEKPDVRLDFLDEEGWTEVGTWCAGKLGARDAVRLHVLDRTR